MGEGGGGCPSIVHRSKKEQMAGIMIVYEGIIDSIHVGARYNTNRSENTKRSLKCSPGSIRD